MSLRAILLPFALFGAAMGLGAVPPAPVKDQSALANNGLVGWEKVTSGLPRGIDYIHRPRDPALKGAAAWFQPVPTADTSAAIAEAARSMGLRDFRVIASRPIAKAKLLDADGHGTAFVGSATRFDRTYRVAAVVIYGSLDESPKTSGVHAFAAPQSLYEELGGWMVPATVWLNLDPAQDVADAAYQGRASPEIQVQRLAGIADIWSEWALNTYIRMAQSNMQALDNARRSAVCAGDPDCVMVPVD